MSDEDFAEGEGEEEERVYASVEEPSFSGEDDEEEEEEEPAQDVPTLGIHENHPLHDGDLDWYQQALSREMIRFLRHADSQYCGFAATGFGRDGFIRVGQVSHWLRTPLGYRTIPKQSPN